MKNADQLPPSRRGEVIGGNYVLGDVLGAGGMGVVHSAIQRSLERTVAVKVPRPELAHDPYVRRRFRNEALAGSRINHPNIVRVLDFGDENGTPFLVMEHVVGPRLAELLHEQGSLPIDVAIELVSQVVSGLEQAHECGVVHADVKCDNVLVETMRDGSTQARLIDFGIARCSGEGIMQTAQDSLITGTAEYVAPEVVRGQVPTSAADVYAIGVMLYELITGTTPFSGGPATSVMCRKLEAEAVPMTWRCPDLEIPVELDQLVARTLEREPAARFANAGELAIALDELIATGRTIGLARRPPELFSTEAPTATLYVTEPPLPPDVEARISITERRLRVIAAIGATDGDATVVAYLELARALLDDRQVDAAITELEEGVELLVASKAMAPVWRLLLTVAALHDGNGERGRARGAAQAAREHARRVGSRLGFERADRLCARLALRRASARSRPW